MQLPQSFYTRQDVLIIARELLGKVLVSDAGGLHTAGMIVETEAYAGVTDKASHAFAGRRTKRTEVMYATGGVAYVYLCYGIHHLFNVVTHTADVPHAVLIRALEPLEGLETMLERRRMNTLKPALTRGPGALTKALGLHTSMTGISLCGTEIWIEDRCVELKADQIGATTRVGVAYAAEDALLPYRFYLRNNPFVSCIPNAGSKKSDS